LNILSSSEKQFYKSRRPAKGTNLQKIIFEQLLWERLGEGVLKKVHDVYEHRL
jgi:hypothetical protein